MSATSLPLARLSQGIENIVVFVCDALRWDEHPQSVRAQGVTFKTVASSLFTAASFPSMVSGLYPHRLGVFSFLEAIPLEIPALTHIPGINFSLWTESAWTRFDPPETAPIYQVLNTRQRISLETIQPPFVYLEDDKGGHAPYGLTFAEYDKPATTFFHEFGSGGLETLRAMYRQGIAQSVAFFQERLKTLEKRGLLDRTLVIFTSDHGELLGEYGGLVEHGRFATPELVFVPTTFIHPALPAGVTVAGHVMRHVDLFPTALAALQRPIPTGLDGVSLLDCQAFPDYGLNYCRRKQPGPGLGARLRSTREERSVWDWGGGYVWRPELGCLRFLSAVSYVFIQRTCGRAFLRAYHRSRPLTSVLRDYGALLKTISAARRRYLEPTTPAAAARRLLAAFSASSEPPTRWMSDIEPDAEVLERLRDLGYVEP